MDNIIQQIEAWNGATTTPLGMLLRTKTYTCFNGLISKLGMELSNVINNTKLSDKQRTLVIKTILAKYNIYNKID